MNGREVHIPTQRRDDGTSVFLVVTGFFGLVLALASPWSEQLLWGVIPAWSMSCLLFATWAVLCWESALRSGWYLSDHRISHYRYWPICQGSVLLDELDHIEKYEEGWRFCSSGRRALKLDTYLNLHWPQIAIEFSKLFPEAGDEFWGVCREAATPNDKSLVPEKPEEVRVSMGRSTDKWMWATALSLIVLDTAFDFELNSFSFIVVTFFLLRMNTKVEFRREGVFPVRLSKLSSEKVRWEDVIAYSDDRVCSEYFTFWTKDNSVNVWQDPDVATARRFLALIPSDAIRMIPYSEGEFKAASFRPHPRPAHSLPIAETDSNCP